MKTGLQDRSLGVLALPSSKWLRAYVGAANGQAGGITVLEKHEMVP